MSINVDQVDEHIVIELGDNHTFVLKSHSVAMVFGGNKNST